METSEIKLENVQGLVRNIWSSVLGLELDTLSPGAAPAVPLGASFSAWVRIIGSNNLTVVLQCSETLARKSAGLMFSASENEVGDEQVKDGLKELVNILGGNVKGMMTKYHFLSMPSVAEPGKEPRFPNSEPLCEFHFKHQEEILKLSLLRMD